MKDLRSPLAKVKGLGADGHGSTEHFWVQRLTALGLVPLVIWLCISLAFLPEATYETVIAWLRSPFNAIMMITLVIVSLQHAHLGIQVIIEDYVSDHAKRLAGILVVKFLSYFLMIVGVYSIIKITLGGV
ncbi:succinate dehydrogenase, hydrophobic membrane anchor protein [Cocleimonas flava]|uniref:Succinate dehydrogenase hydrophobic membrane anchor subunit n=1 Tax=Cocleimonas flava TaxID=634765 RepID=A0A4R1F4F3_9GAMM|nr:MULTISPECIES: succinate dehydrogenase, hydrophobic membrane anchor protein [Cocleimonas]MEB8431757.1 succinate dehydrogenase, hydrophobic membrane anchor protein [Cocleimonas sp. KMM 6892]MEC4715157.1 succinate dehydrogenase, hydrophobic membrane anchor protein [Cocleimonas sp. KMM 6895]MEC4744029.1 succinate dehydrogenase, hydrophobic membrane anchor protein [Cocleimonas sp. KMM 6896]TCJ87379.1 succinate dehydrogenase subunit D [Cocleimonas flava]